jgi:hypothetical protein
LKNYTQPYVVLLCGCNECIGASSGDFYRFFREDMQALVGGGDALFGVQTGGTADDHQIHGAVFQEGGEVLIRSSSVFVAEMSDFFEVGAVDSGDFDPGDGSGRAGVSFRDVAAAD